MKRTFTQDERNIVFDLWKQEAGFSDIGHLTDPVTAISDLLYRFNLEFFCIAFATHNKYLLFTSIVTLSGIYNTRGMPTFNLSYFSGHYHITICLCDHIKSKRA